MAEGWVNPSAPSCPVPDRSTCLDDVRHSIPRSGGRAHDRSGAYETLISRAISQVFAQWVETPRQPEPAPDRDDGTLPPHPRLLEFVDALFDEDVRLGRAIAAAVFSEHDDPQRMAGSLFGPAASFIGEKWVADEADFLQVTIALSRMQQMFSRMAADRPPTARPDPARRLLLAPAPGEQHSFGLSIVEDAFQRAGWEVDRCQCNEDERVLKLAETNDYLVIGLSVGAGRQLPDLKSIVARLRAVSRNRSVVLMAGGSLVVQNPQSALDSDFDFAAVDAPSGVRLADALVSRPVDGTRLQAAAE